MDSLHFGTSSQVNGLAAKSIGSFADFVVAVSDFFVSDSMAFNPFQKSFRCGNNGGR